MAGLESLEQLRQRIDALDVELQTLLNERAGCVLEVAEVKRAAGGAVQYYRPEREAQIFARVRERNQGPLPADTMVRLFREIISASMALEKPLAVAYAGFEGDQGYASALQHFGRGVSFEQCDTIDQVFDRVERTACDFGVVPANSGGDTFAALLRSPLGICGETPLPGAAGNRCLVIGKQQVGPSGHDKTSVLMTINDQPGALQALLEPLAKNHVNVVHIASQPASSSVSGSALLLDLDGHREDPTVALSLQQVEQLADTFKVLGSYPASVA